MVAGSTSNSTPLRLQSLTITQPDLSGRRPSGRPRRTRWERPGLGPRSTRHRHLKGSAACSQPVRTQERRTGSSVGCSCAYLPLPWSRSPFGCMQPRPATAPLTLPPSSLPISSEPLAANAGERVEGFLKFKVNESRSYTLHSELWLVRNGQPGSGAGRGAPETSRKGEFLLHQQTFNYSYQPVA